jgi:hypothetical protein
MIHNHHEQNTCGTIVFGVAKGVSRGIHKGAATHRGKQGARGVLASKAQPRCMGAYFGDHRADVNRTCQEWE